MRKAFLWLIGLAAVFSLSLPVQAFELGVRGYYWFPTLTGDIRVDGRGIVGTTLDLKRDSGLDDESYPVVEAFVGVGDHHLSLSYYRADYSGTNTLNNDITFSGKTFVAAIPISTSLEYDVYDLTYQYDLLDLENILAGFSLGLVGRVKLFDGTAGFRSSVQSASEDFTAPIPMVGVNFHLGILADYLEARMMAAGIGYGGGTMFDGQADISFTPFPFLDIHGGYRAFFVDVDADSVDFNYDTSGPYVALTVGF